MRIAIVGTRHVHAPGLARLLAQRGHEVIAFERIPAVAAEWDGPGASPERDLDAVLVGVDAAVVVGTNVERTADVLACVRAGIPVLAEKPVACRPEDVAALRAEAAASDLVMVALPVRFAPALQRSRALLASGALGQPLAARTTNHGTFPGGWFGQKELSGGGALMDHVVHLSDVLCWLLDDHVASVDAEAGRRLHDGIDVEDCGLVTLDFASGFFASIDCSWSRPRTFPGWGDVWLEIVGTLGRVVVDPLAERLILMDDAAGGHEFLQFGADMTGLMVDAFLAFAAGEVSSPVPLADGLHASEVVFAAYEAAGA